MKRVPSDELHNSELEQMQSTANNPLAAFSYRSINAAARDEKTIYCGKFFAQRNHQEGGHDYIDFVCFDVENKNAKLPDMEDVYITIDDTIEDNMEKAWNAILPVLIQHEVYSVRVVQAGSRYAHNITLPKCSQQIVLARYCDQDSSAQRWNQILYDITRALVAADVIPGPINTTANYDQILNAFCLRKKVPITGGALAALTAIQVHGQPQPKIITRQAFSTAVSSTTFYTSNPKGSRSDLRKTVFSNEKQKQTPDASHEAEKLLKSRKPDDDDPHNGSGSADEGSTSFGNKKS